ncbi:MAG: ABC transporter permease, partial [Faecousia sp.]
MTRYVLKRLLVMIPLLIAVGIIMFTLMNFVPGDPAQLALGSGFHTEEELALKREAMGLNRPFVVRMAEYVKNIFLHFDFGTSLIDGTDIKFQLLKRFPNTFYIAVFSIILTVIIGLPLGVYTAVHANSLGDKISLFVTLLFDCMPSFWTAL